MSSTEDFTSSKLLVEEQKLILQTLDISTALQLGVLAQNIGINRGLPIAIEVRIGDWVIYHASLPGSSIENNLWLERKAKVVKLKHHSTLYERVKSEEQFVDWFVSNMVSEVDYAIHGGGLPLITKEDGFVGALIISGLPQLDDHLLGVEVLTLFLARKNELL